MTQSLQYMPVNDAYHVLPTISYLQSNSPRPTDNIDCWHVAHPREDSLRPCPCTRSLDAMIKRVFGYRNAFHAFVKHAGSNSSGMTSPASRW